MRVRHDGLAQTDAAVVARDLAVGEADQACFLEKVRGQADEEPVLETAAGEHDVLYAGP